MESLILNLLKTTTHPEVRETIIRQAPYFQRVIKTPRDMEIATKLLEGAKRSELQRALIGALPILLQEIKEQDDVDTAVAFLAEAV